MIMLTKTRLLGILLGCVLLVGLAAGLVVRERTARCAAVPVLAENLLPNADMARPAASSPLPAGWQAGAPGVQPVAFAMDGDGRALQLMGIANYIQLPPVAVQPGQSYCVRAHAITDTPQGAPVRLRLTFRWLDNAGNLITTEATSWQAAMPWAPDDPPERWATLGGAFRAPPGASTLQVRMQPSADDRVYVDTVAVRRGGTPPERVPEAVPPDVAIQPWPDGQRAALSFSFDWETAMGGLIHSRSVGDPNFDDDPVLRGLRMREGITTTLALFAPHGIRATYYATGYNFLDGNTEGIEFMGNPTYSTWADTAHGWVSDRWTQTPWFAPDPHGTVATHPAWYFGDLVAPLQAAQQDIQSHTFSHFYGGFVGPADWQADLAAWEYVAARQNVPPAQSLAFPWSGSGGMSEANWQVLQAAGIRSVTRLSDQGQYNLFPTDERGLIREPHCRPLPGHEEIIACPDIYLTPASVEQVLAQIDYTLVQGGAIDIWAHTEEVVSPEQQATWRRVIDYAAAQEGLWITPLHEIAAWQHALRDVRVEHISSPDAPGEPLTVAVHNPPPGLTLRLPFVPERLQVIDSAHAARTNSAPPAYRIEGEMLTIEQGASGEAIRIEAWPTISKD
jgi:hypothetical protein